MLFDPHLDASKGAADFVELHHFAALPKYAKELDKHYAELLAAAVYYRNALRAHKFQSGIADNGQDYCHPHDDAIARFTPPRKSQEHTP